MKARFLVLIVFGILFLTHCERDKNPVLPDPDNFVYPTKIGNEWHYDRFFYFKMLDNDPQGGTVLSDTTNGKSILKIIDEVVLHDSITTFQFNETLTEDGQSYSGGIFYANRTDGLFRLAYKGVGYCFPKQGAANKIIFKGYVFNSVSEMTNFFTEPVSLFKTGEDSLIYENTPAQTLAYPMEVGRQWTEIVIDSMIRIDKKILGREKVKAPAGTFNCFKIRYYYDFDLDGKWDNDIFVYEYVSSQGLVKRSGVYLDLYRTDETGTVIGSGDAGEQIILTKLNLE